MAPVSMTAEAVIELMDRYRIAVRLEARTVPVFHGFRRTIVPDGLNLMIVYKYAAKYNMLVSSHGLA